MSDFAEVARRTSRVIEWLTQLQTAIAWATSPNTDFVAIVDGLVGAGDVSFLKLQLPPVVFLRRLCGTIPYRAGI